MTRKSIALLSFFLALTGCRTLREEGPSFGTTPWAQTLVDTPHIAVLTSSANDGNSPQSSVPSVKFAAFPIAGWWVAPQPSSDNNDTQYASLLNDGSVLFVTEIDKDLNGGPTFPTPWLIVAFQEHVTLERGDDMLSNFEKLSILHRNWNALPGVFYCRAHGRTRKALAQLAQQLSSLEGVRYVELDRIFTLRRETIWNIPDDPGFDLSWALLNRGQTGGKLGIDLDAPEAWTQIDPASSVIVAVLDDGVESTHEDLIVVPGQDFTTDQTPNGDPANECDNHGTFVAGCITGAFHNKYGTAGIAPNCRVSSGKIAISTVPCDGSTFTQASWTVDALTFAESIGARISNNSNSYGLTSPSIDLKYQTSRDGGMVHFASAGNDGTPSIAYPANLPTVNAVGAVDATGRRASFSNYGAGLAFVAPGVGIWTTDRTGLSGQNAGDFANVNGTSFSSPFAAGVAALMLCVDSGSDPITIETRMRSATVDVGEPGIDDQTGSGLINAFNSVLAQKGQPQRFYVNLNANGNNDGSSWTDAFVSLSDGVAAANQVPRAQLWVAKGRYLGTRNLNSHLSVYGGFAGNETSIEERNIEANPTIFSGDINGDDGTGSYDDNRQVLSVQVDRSVLLDGLIIRDGRGLRYTNRPGGIENFGVLTLRNCVLEANQGTDGGAIRNHNILRTEQCIFRNNRASNYDGNAGDGGGIYTDGYAVQYGNRQHYKVSTFCAATRFERNSAVNAGGAVFQGENGRAEFAGCIFVRNSNTAVFNAADAQTWITNCVFYSNMGSPSAIKNTSGLGVEVANCILWRPASAHFPDFARSIAGQPTIRQSIVKGWTGVGISRFTDSGGNSPVNPSFVSLSNGQEDFRLQPFSRAIDAGVNVIWPGHVMSDFGGLSRFYDDSFVPDTGEGDPPLIDIGAHEYNGRRP